MNKHQILRNLFGYLSEEESASSHEMNHQSESYSDEKGGGTELANDAISTQHVEIDGDLQLNEDAISSRSNDEGVEHEKQTTKEQVINNESGAELHHEARSKCNSDGGATFENESTFTQIVKTEGGAVLNDETGGASNETRSSRLIKTENENDKDPVQISDVIHAVFGDSDDEPAQYGVEYGHVQEKNNSKSSDHKVNYERDPESEGTASCEHTEFMPEGEKAEDKLEGHSICRMLVLEIPKRNPLADPSQMITTELPEIIGFNDKPFDPTTYVEEEFYITDASGSERLIPPTNIIQWRNVVNPDGTTSIESNARIVNWSDGSLQLFIGNETFDVTEEDTKRILSHALLWNEGIYQSLARISKLVKVPSSSSVSDSDSSTVFVGRDTTPVPETAAEHIGQYNPKTSEDNPSLSQKNNDEEVTSNHNLKQSEEHICPSDAEDVNLEGPKDPH